MIPRLDLPTGPILGVDCSNWTTKRLAPYLDGLYDAGVRVFFPQAVDPPSPYPPTQTRAQISDLLKDGRFIIAPYVFWWAFAGTGYLGRQLATLSGYEGVLDAISLDEEDTTIGLVGRILHPQRHLSLPQAHLERLARQAYPRSSLARPIARLAGAPAAALVDDISSWWDVLAQFPTTSGELLDYSGPWYYGPYLGNPTRFAAQGHRWWTAQYDNIVDPQWVTSWGGFSPPADAKQYVGTTSLAGLDQIDLSVINSGFYTRLVGRTNIAIPRITRGVQVDVLNNPRDPALLAADGFDAVKFALRDADACRNYASAAKQAGLVVAGVQDSLAQGYMLDAALVDVTFIGNEPDGQPGTASSVRTPAEFANDLRIYRGTWPNHTLIVGGMVSGQPDYVRQVLAADPGCMTGYAAISVHPWGKVVGDAQTLLSSYATFGLQIVVGEWNRPTDEILDYQIMLTTESVQSYWFCLGDWMEPDLGLRDASDRAKPQWAEYLHLAPDACADLRTALSDVTGADGEIVSALQNASKLTTVKAMRPAVQAVVSRLGAIHDQFLSGGA